MSYLRIGRVAAVHHADHSVDLVMADDGSRLTGVQVLAAGGSTNTGTVNLPEPTATSNKWDLSTRTDRDALAVVGRMAGDVWVVLGWMLPQVSQMTFEAGRYVQRLPSDVYTSVDAAGNLEVVHPSGVWFRVGESADHEGLAGKNFDGSWSITKNTGKHLHVRLHHPKADVHITPDGDVTLAHDRHLTINTGGNATVTVGGTASVTATGAATVTAPSVTLDTPSTHCKGNLTVDGVTTTGGLTSNGSAGGVSITGAVSVAGTLTNNGVNVGSTHVHGNVLNGPSSTAVPN